MVEHIKRLGSKLELAPFPDREQAKERRIQVPKGWASEGIASCVAEGVKRWRSIRGGIEPLRCRFFRKLGIPDLIQMFITSPACLPGIRDIASADGSKSNA